MRYHIIPTRITQIKKHKPNIGEEEQQPTISYTADGITQSFLKTGCFI